MSDALDTTHGITKLIKFSPCREGIFNKMRETLQKVSEGGGIRRLCPTRWTVRAEALSSIMKNYSALLNTWEEAVDAVKDSSTKARILGVASQMKSFEYVFGNLLGQLVLNHADNLSAALQHRHLSAAEGQRIAHMTVETLKSVRSEESFDLFREKAGGIFSELDISEPRIPRRRRLPRRYDDGQSEGDFHDRQIYYEAIVICIEDRFNQPGYQV